jgi:hypothetical protein
VGGCSVRSLTPSLCICRWSEVSPVPHPPLVPRAIVKQASTMWSTPTLASHRSCQCSDVCALLSPANGCVRRRQVGLSALGCVAAQAFLHCVSYTADLEEGSIVFVGLFMHGAGRLGRTMCLDSTRRSACDSRVRLSTCGGLLGEGSSVLENRTLCTP